MLYAILLLRINPNPFPVVWKLLSSLGIILKILSIQSGRIPLPVSVTVNDKTPFYSSEICRTISPLNVYWRAFEIKLARTYVILL